MPTEMEVLRETLRQRKLQAESAQQTQEKARVSEVEAGLIKKEEATNTAGDDNVITKGEAVNAFKQRREDSRTNNVKELAQGLDDMARVAAGPAGNALAGVMGGQGAEAEAAKTAEAAARMNPGSAGPIAAAGQIGQAAVLPGAAFATPLRAAGTMGGLSMFDTMLGKMEKGEPINEGLEEYLDAGLQGAATGVAGYHIGKLTGAMIAKLGKHDDSLTAAAQKAMNENKAIENAGADAMRNSGVVIKRQAMHKMLRDVERELERFEFTPRTAREGWKAMNILRDRVLKGTDIDIGNFNELRKMINRSIRTPNGAYKQTINDNDLRVTWEITKAMKKFIENLPNTKSYVRGGNVKQAVEGWAKMNEFHQKVARTEDIMQFIANAEHAAVKGKKNFEQALQDEISSLFSSEKGREILNRQFTTSQRQVLRKIADGDLSQKTFARLDRITGGAAGMFAPVVRVLKATHGTVTGAEESRELARKAISSVAEQGIKRPVAPRIGTASSRLGNQALSEDK